MKRLLIIGCGDVATRALPRLVERYEVTALVRSPQAAASLSRRGVRLLQGDLDRAESLVPLAGAADVVLHSAPPQGGGSSDTRTRNLLAALAGASKGGASLPRQLPRRIVYLGTSGVYGDCGGEWVDETRALHPCTDRARRRADAERALDGWCKANGTACVVLRVPGIYAADRLPLERLRSGAPALRADDDVYTNHIHAEDLASIIVSALEREDVQGVFNACDDTDMKAGDWLDLVADRAGLPRPPRVARDEAAKRLTPMQWSFLSESRRLANRSMKARLGVTLRFPTVRDGVPSAALSD